MGNAFGAGLDNEAPRGRDVTVRDRRIEESHTQLGALPTFRSHIVPLLLFKVYSYSPRIILNEIAYAVERRVLLIFWLK